MYLQVRWLMDGGVAVRQINSDQERKGRMTDKIITKRGVFGCQGGKNGHYPLVCSCSFLPCRQNSSTLPWRSGSSTHSELFSTR